MEHLNAESLARLVDHPATPEEAGHLASCPLCVGELAAFREQTAALGALPEIVPPLGDWEVLEARLRSEGLVKDPGLLDRLGLARTPPWMKAAAAVLLFLTGTALGAGMSVRPDAGPLDGSEARFASQELSMDEAAAAVRAAEQNYVEALARYRFLLSQESGEDASLDPSRYAALEYLLAASQAAVRQAPADPFLNGLLASTMAEREAMVRQISSQQTWF